MPSKKHQYDLVQNDDYDTRIPLHPDEAFHHGIIFHAKYIGMLDVPRPSSRVEIVAAMRRIRYEFKAKGIKKKKVTIEVSVDGVKVTLRKKKKVKHWDDSKPFLLSNPIYRIFYVSHDSQDLKIFSYIARDGASNVFKCAVFKSNKKSQALRVVRTIGQAFEVCHKLSINAPENERQQDQDEQDTLTQDLVSDRLSDITSDKHKKDYLSEVASDKMSLPPDDYNIRDIYNEPKVSKPKLDVLAPPPTSNTNRKTPLTTAETYSAPHSDNLTSMNGSGSSLPPPGGALSAHHELQLMREQLEQQNQQTQAAMAQLQLAREQLAAEQSARLEAQSRTHQLLVHNRELLDHIAALVAHLQGSEKSGQQQNAPHMTMPQQNCEDSYLNDLPLDNGPLFHSLIENRAVTSPLRASYPGGNIFNFAYPPPLDPVSPTFDPQLFYSPYFNYNAHLLPNLYASPYATLQRPPKKLVGVSRISPTRSEPYQSQTALYPLQMQQGVNNPVQANQERRSGDVGAQYLQRGSQETGAQYNQRNSQETGAQYNQRSSQETGAQYNQRNSQDTQYNQRSSQERLQHSQRGCQDSDRSRMMNSTDGTGRMMGNLRIGDDLRVPNGAPITRSTSEKVPNRSELMSQVQRTLWARHTTK